MQTDAQKLIVVRDQFALKGLSDDALKQILPAYRESLQRLEFLLRTMPEGNIQRELWLRTQLATIEAQFRPVADRIYQVLPEAQARAFEEGLTNARKYLEAGGIQPEPAATTTLSGVTAGGQHVSVTGNLPGFNVTNAMNKGFISPSITRQQIVAAARETGFSVLSPGGSKVGLADLLPKWMAAQSDQVARHLRAGFLVGNSNDEIMREIGPLGPGRKGWAMTEAVVRTSMAEASQSAHDAFYDANEDLLPKTKSGFRWWWDASNDTRLCPECAPLDGIKFKERNEPPHAWPAHFSCRCRLLPITATMELLEEEDGPASGSFLEATPVEYDRRGKRKDPPPGYTGENAYKRPMKIDGKQQWVRRRDLGPGQTTAGDMLKNTNEHSKKLVLGKHTEAFNKLTGKGGKYEKDPQGAVRQLLGNPLPPGSTPPRPTRGPGPKPTPPAHKPAVTGEQFNAYLKDNSFAMPGRRFDGGDVAAMVNDGAKQSGEIGKSFQRLQEFVVKDGQVLFVSETEAGLAKRVGAYGVRELTKADVPWALSDGYKQQISRALGSQILEGEAFHAERIPALVRNEKMLKEKIARHAAQGWDDTISKGNLAQVRKDLRTSRAYIKDLPRRYSSVSLGLPADGHTSSFQRSIVVTDDFDELLHSPFDKTGRVDIDGLSKGIGNNLGARAKPSLTTREAMDTYEGRRRGTRNESVLYTYIHETGHQVYFRAGSPPPPKLKWRAPTGYGETNTDELFAESFAAYTLNPKALREYDEGLFRWVESAYAKALGNAGKPLF